MIICSLLTVEKAYKLTTGPIDIVQWVRVEQANCKSILYPKKNLPRKNSSFRQTSFTTAFVCHVVAFLSRVVQDFVQFLQQLDEGGVHPVPIPSGHDKAPDNNEKNCNFSLLITPFTILWNFLQLAHTGPNMCRPLAEHPIISLLDRTIFAKYRFPGNWQMGQEKDVF